jgi:antitoxin ParD1/3/4/toxin ParE1/3/4
VSSVRFTALAEADLANIVDFIARSAGAERADRVLSAVLDAAERLAANPRIGHKREDLTDDNVRFWSVHSFLLVYRTHRRTVEIVRVVSGWRDLTVLLERGAE